MFTGKPSFERVDGKKAPELLREYGPDYEEKLIKQIVRTSVRDAIAEMESSVVYQESIKMAAIWMSVSLGFLPALAFGTLRNGKAFSRSFRICW